MELKQIAKSKTVNFNVFMPLILTLLPSLGFEVTPEIASAILGLGNIALRFITKNAIKDK